jgi:hypothetical protein
MCCFKRFLLFSACLLLLSALVSPRLVYSTPSPPPPTEHGDPDEIIERPRPPQETPGGRGAVDKDESYDEYDWIDDESGWSNFLSAFRFMFSVE